MQSTTPSDRANMNGLDPKSVGGERDGSLKQKQEVLKALMEPEKKQTPHDVSLKTAGALFLIPT